MRAPPGPNSFNFMQFLGKFGKIVCWRLPWRVGAPSSGKSWIRHCIYIPLFYGTENFSGYIQNRNWCGTSHGTQTNVRRIFSHRLRDFGRVTSQMVTSHHDVKFKLVCVYRDLFVFTETCLCLQRLVCVYRDLFVFAETCLCLQRA